FQARKLQRSSNCQIPIDSAPVPQPGRIRHPAQWPALGLGAGRFSGACEVVTCSFSDVAGRTNRTHSGVPPAASTSPLIRPLGGVGLLRSVNRVLPIGRKLHPLLGVLNPSTGLVGIPFEGREVVHPIAWRKPAAA